jgi:hypothetical protein
MSHLEYGVSLAQGNKRKEVTNMTTVTEIIETTLELKEFFPDLRDSEVFEHVGFVHQAEYSFDMCIGRVILTAYDHGEKEAYRWAKFYFGIDFKPRR